MREVSGIDGGVEMEELAMKSAKWLEDSLKKLNELTEEEERWGRKKFIEERKIFNLLSLFPEALVELDVLSSEIVKNLVSSFARELGRDRRSSFSGVPIQIDVASVHERRTAYILQIVTYIKMWNIEQMLIQTAQK